MQVVARCVAGLALFMVTIFDCNDSAQIQQLCPARFKAQGKQGEPESLQVDSAPVFRPPLHSRARRPGQARLVDVLTASRIAFVTVVNDHVEAEPALAALLALMVRDLLDDATVRLLTDAFTDTIPLG